MFAYFLKTKHNSFVVGGEGVAADDDVTKNQYYYGYLRLGVVCCWLYRNHAQYWKKVTDAHDVEAVLCWKMCAAWMSFLEAWEIFVYGSSATLPYTCRDRD